MIDIRDCGAVGDGVADDTAAIQMAAAEAGPGGFVLIPDGVYLTSAPIEISKHLQILGAGGSVDDARPVIRATGSYPIFDLSASSRIEVDIEDITLWGGSHGVYASTSVGALLTKSRLRRVYCRGQSVAGIWLDGPSVFVEGVLDDVYVRKGSPQYGVVMRGDHCAQASLWSGVWVGHATVAGVLVEHPDEDTNQDYLTMIKPVIEGCPGVGLHLLRSGAVMVGSWFEANGLDDIVLEGGGAGSTRIAMLGGHFLAPAAGHATIRFATDRCQVSADGTSFAPGCTIDADGFSTGCRISLVGLPRVAPALVGAGGVATVVASDGHVWASGGLGSTVSPGDSLGAMIGTVQILGSDGTVIGVTPVYESE